MFKYLDIDTSSIEVDHINGIKDNNNISNLRLVTHQQNHLNRTTAKGIYKDKHGKWIAKIRVNNRIHSLPFERTQAELISTILILCGIVFLFYSKKWFPKSIVNV